MGANTPTDGGKLVNMRNLNALLVILALALLSSCAKKEETVAGTEAPKSTAATPEAEASNPGPRAFIHLKNGSKIPGSIVASSRTDMVVAGDDGIEHKIPLTQIKSVEYATETAQTQQARPLTPAPRVAPEKRTAVEPKAVEPSAQQPSERASAPSKRHRRPCLQRQHRRRVLLLQKHTSYPRGVRFPFERTKRSIRKQPPKGKLSTCRLRETQLM